MKKILIAIVLAVLLFVPARTSALEIAIEEKTIEDILMPYIDDYQDSSGKITVKQGESSVEVVPGKILINVPITYKFIFDIPLNCKLEYELVDDNLCLTKAKCLFFDQMERFENISKINTSSIFKYDFVNLSIDEGQVTLSLFENLKPEIKPEADKKVEEIPSKEVEVKEELKPDTNKEVETKKEVKADDKIKDDKTKVYDIKRSDIVKVISEHEQELLNELPAEYNITALSANEDESINITLDGKDLTIFGNLSFNQDLDIVYNVTHVKYSFLKVSIDNLGKITKLIGFDLPKGIEQITFCNGYVKPYLGIASNEKIIDVVETAEEFTVTTTK